MKTKILMLLILFAAASMSAIAQKTDKKAERQQRKLERENQVKKMLDAKEFVFVGRRALPQGYKSVDLTTNPNFVKFNPDKIESAMPYFGRAYSVPYGGDGGLKFKGEPEDFTIEITKKGYQVNAKVKGDIDRYILSMEVGSRGDATLTISSNNRNSISYQGDINAPEAPKEK